MVFVGNISIILYSIHGVYKPMVISMGDLQDPIYTWRYVNVPDYGPYFAGIFPEI
jgi:hypothetical protein